MDDVSWKTAVESRLDFLQRENLDLKAALKNILRENENIRSEFEAMKNILRKHVQDTDEKCNRNMKKSANKEIHTSVEDEFGIDPERDGQRVARIVPPSTSTISSIAFYSYLSKNSGPITAHHTLVYDVSHINRGNGYNKNDGIFIAPVSGVYVFHFSVCIGGSAYASFEILVNGEVIGAVNEESHTGMGYREGSNLVVTFANSGDHVFIRTQRSTIGYVFSNDMCKTSFSGWFLTN
ncbi:complement C1q-like protein 4 [Saccostrea cucullata]|uniref:complement C1q-like protein 4 n=1 Tax=Saccostrea cuccullata TaxID=36930 RepID=UPI002ED010D2